MSLVLGVKIAQYTLPRGSRNLQASFTNYQFEKEIQIYRTPNNHYNGIYSSQKMSIMTFAQNIVLSVKKPPF